MRRRAWWVVGSLVCGAGAVAVPLLARSGTLGRAAVATPQAPVGPAATPDDPAELKRALQAAMRRIDALEQSARRGEPGDQEQSVRRPTRKEPPSPEEERAQKEATRNKLHDLVAGERRDVAWAPANEQKLRDLAAKQPGETVIDEVSCKTSVCRVAFVHTSQADQHNFLEGFRRELPDDTLAANFDPTAVENGHPKTVCHIFRRGYPLPQM
jgi:hypothetical protein